MTRTDQPPSNSSTSLPHALPQQDLALPTSSLVLVTGATGFIASHIIQQLLSLGFHVRATVRTASKASTSQTTTHQNHPNYSTAIVPDIAAPNAFQDAIRNVDAIVHVASDTSLSSDPNTVIPAVKTATLNLLEAAAATDSVKRVVLTSSSTAAGLPPDPHSGDKPRFGESTWNDSSVAQAWDTPKHERQQNAAAYGFLVYAASKAEGERAAWRFMQERKPGFVLNTVLPNFNMGAILPGVAPGPTGAGVISAYRGEKEALELFGPQWMVDVRDDARVHVGALVDKGVVGRRVFAFARPFNWNDILEVVRKVRPDSEVMGDMEGLGRDGTTVDNELARELLGKWFGQQDWTPLEETVRQNLEGVE